MVGLHCEMIAIIHDFIIAVSKGLENGDIAKYKIWHDYNSCLSLKSSVMKIPDQHLCY